ncbi:hypothetical protein JHK87_018941 [Glycine soja]|nr:hypothetical protein JHK87_018941 [Glycine soja]
MAWSQLSQIKVSEIHPGLHSWPVKAKTIQMWTTQDKKDNTRVPYLQLILFDSGSIGCALSNECVDTIKEFFEDTDDSISMLSILGINSYVKSAVSFWPHFRFSPSPLKTLSFSRSPPNLSQKNDDLKPLRIYCIFVSIYERGVGDQGRNDT